MDMSFKVGNVSVYVLATLLLIQCAICEIEGHSGVVFHVNKYGHYSGHSTHYDYRFYPEKTLLDHLIAHHNHDSYHHLIQDSPHHKHNSYHHLIPDSHFDNDVGYGVLGDDHDYPGSHEPFYYFLHDDEHHFHH